MTSDEKAAPMIDAFLRERGQLEDRVFRRVGCRATAADLVQDLFLRLWRRSALIPEVVPSYLIRSARNIAIDHQRSAAVRNAMPLEDAPNHIDEAPAQDIAFAARQDLQAVRTVLLALPPRVRRVFLLNRIHLRSYAEIAMALGVSVSTVEKDMMHALAACRRAVDRS